jgi:hypothetical protein
MSTAVDGAARGVLLGIAWGAVFDAAPLGYSVGAEPTGGRSSTATPTAGPRPKLVVPQAQLKPTSAGMPLPSAARRGAVAVASSMVRSSIGFAGFLGVYNGVTCSMETLRGGRKDLVNSLVGGFAAGACAGLSSGNPRTVLVSAMGTGCITAGVTLFTGGTGFQGGKSS